MSQLALHLDAPHLEPLEPILDALEGLPILCWVAQATFISMGPSVTHHLRLAGFDTALDLRLSGEARSVGLAVQAARRLAITAVTVDLGAGLAVAVAAKQAARGSVMVIGVPTPLDRPTTESELSAGLAIADRAHLDGVLLAPDSTLLPSRGQRITIASEPRAGFDTVVFGDRILAAADPRAEAQHLLAVLAALEPRT